MSVTPTKKRFAPGFAFRFSLRLTQKMAASSRRSDQGLTLIEGLVAIVVVSITLVSITPPIFWATGTRVQNRRAEQALQLAQGEIDRVRTIVDQGQATLKLLPPVGADNIRLANSVAAPTSAKSGIVTVNPSCKITKNNGESPAIGEYIQINTDPNPEDSSDCKPNFLMQTFRSTGLDGDGKPITDTTTIPEGFVMGVRVYSIVAEPNLIGSKAETTQASLKGTNGLGNQLTRPLAVQYSTIVRSNASKNLDLYRKLCSDTTGKGQC